MFMRLTLAIAMGVTLGITAPCPGQVALECPLGDGVVHVSHGTEMVICNRHYRAVLSTVSGELLSATRRDAAAGSASIRRDRIRVKILGQQAAVDLGTRTKLVQDIENDFSFYLRVMTRVSVQHAGAT